MIMKINTLIVMWLIESILMELFHLKYCYSNHYNTFSFFLNLFSKQFINLNSYINFKRGNKPNSLGIIPVKVL